MCLTYPLPLPFEGRGVMLERGAKPLSYLFPSPDQERVRVRSCINIPYESKNQIQTEPLLTSVAPSGKEMLEWQ